MPLAGPYVGIFGLISNTVYKALRIDPSTHAAETCSVPHSEAHKGSRYYVHYSVPSLGAMAAPDDMITLTWTTPNKKQWEHFTFYAKGTGGWRVRLIEAPSGGAASQTEQFPFLNHNRNSSKVSSAIALDSTAGEASYDATLATGGTTLWDDYIPGNFKSSGEGGSDRDEIILKQNTKYQLSIFGADTDPATLHIDFYEHTDKN